MSTAAAGVAVGALIPALIPELSSVPHQAVNRLVRQNGHPSFAPRLANVVVIYTVSVDIILGSLPSASTDGSIFSFAAAINKETPRMKLAQFSVIAILVTTAGAALAAAPAKKPLSHWTCEEFLAVDDQFKPKVVYWATAYSKGGKPTSAMIDIDGTETVTPAIIDSCVKTPKSSFWQTLKGEWKKFEATTKKDVKKIEKSM
jgi:acid stress chaperone HdeA